MLWGFGLGRTPHFGGMIIPPARLPRTSCPNTIAHDPQKACCLGIQRGARPCSAANVEPNLPIRRLIRRDRWLFGASSVAHRCAQVVHAWIASSAGITMPVNQFPLSVLPSVDLSDAKVYGLRRTAGDRSRASFEADQVCQIPADSGSQDFEFDRCPVRVQRGDATEGLADLRPSELAGLRGRKERHRI